MTTLVAEVVRLVEHTLGFTPTHGVSKPHPKLRGRTLVEASNAFAGDDSSLVDLLRPVTVAGADAAVDLDRFEALAKGQGHSTGPGPARVVTGLAWSRDAPALRRAVSTLLPGQPNPFAHLPALLAHLHHLDLSGGRLSALGDVASLSGLSKLNVSGNRLRDIGDLPPRLESLHAYGNALESFEAGAGAAAALVHAGLGFNRLARVPPCLLHCRALVSLDLAHNDLCDLEELLGAAAAGGLGELRHLVLAGNPCALEYLYPARVLAALPGLASLDDELITEAARDLQHAAQLALLVAARVLPPPPPGAPAISAPRARQLFRSVSFGDEVHLAVTLSEVCGLPQPADVYALFGWPEGGPDALRPQTGSVGTLPRAAAGGGAAAAAGGGGTLGAAQSAGARAAAGGVRGSVGASAAALAAAAAASAAVAVGPVPTYVLRLRLPGASLDVETPPLELGGQPPAPEAVQDAAEDAAGGGGRPSSALSRSGAADAAPVSGAPAKKPSVVAGKPAGGASVAPDAKGTAASAGGKGSSKPSAASAGGKAVSGGAKGSGGGEDVAGEASSGAAELPTSKVHWQHRSVVTVHPSVALRDALEFDQVVIELIEIPPPPPSPTAHRVSASQASLPDLTAPGASAALDFDLSRELAVVAQTAPGRVLGATAGTSTAPLLRAPGLQAVHTLPLALPLACHTLPAQTLAAVERCLAAGPPPPPPPPPPEPKKGGGPAAAPAAAAAAAAGAGAAGTAAAALPPPGPPPPTSLDEAVAALVAKSRPAVSASVGVYVLEVVPALSAVLRPDSEASTVVA